MAKSDFLFKDFGTVVLLTPLSERAFKWSSENINLEDWQNLDNIELEPRLFYDIAKRIKNEGMILLKC